MFLMQEPDRLKKAMARCAAQLERLEESRRRLEARLGIDPDDAAEHLDEEVVDGLEELWAVDVNVPLDTFLDQAPK
jgi:hypothetical protein